MADDKREQLIAQRSRIQSDIEGIRAGENLGPERDTTSDLSGNDQHAAEEGTETFDRERDLSILDSLDTELGEIEAALGRLDDGTYGVCEVCGRPIGSERLDAVPATRYCIEHERSREQASR